MSLLEFPIRISPNLSVPCVATRVGCSVVRCTVVRSSRFNTHDFVIGILAIFHSRYIVRFTDTEGKRGERIAPRNCNMGAGKRRFMIS